MRVGVVDIGTNSTRLLIANVFGGVVKEVSRHVVVTRLGQGVDATGVLAEEAIARTIEVLERYGHEMALAGVGARQAIATSATRDAANAYVFLDGAEAALAVRPEVIDGEEEARLSFSGATIGSNLATSIVIDLGGGSTEFVAGSYRPEYARSVDIGAVRLTERMPDRRPTPPGDISHARSEVANLFAAQLELPPSDGVIGVAGTLTALSAMHLRLAEYDRTAVHQSTLTTQDLEDLTQELGAMTIDEIAAVPSMDPARAPVILAGAIIAHEALAVTGHDEMTISETDILDGVALALAESA